VKMPLETEIKAGTICNNNCVFCLNHERDNIKPLAQIKSEIMCAKNAGITTINFTGGEITIREDFFEIIDFANDNRLRTCIQTNGRIFNYEDFCDRILPKNVSLFLVSFHAHNEELNRKMTLVRRGYHQTKKGIVNLLHSKQNVQINVVVTQV